MHASSHEAISSSDFKSDNTSVKLFLTLMCIMHSFQLPKLSQSDILNSIQLVYNYAFSSMEVQCKNDQELTKNCMDFHLVQVNNVIYMHVIIIITWLTLSVIDSTKH